MMISDHPIIQMKILNISRKKEYFISPISNTKVSVQNMRASPADEAPADSADLADYLASLNFVNHLLEKAVKTLPGPKASMPKKFRLRNRILKAWCCFFSLNPIL